MVVLSAELPCSVAAQEYLLVGVWGAGDWKCFFSGVPTDCTAIGDAVVIDGGEAQPTSIALVGDKSRLLGPGDIIADEAWEPVGDISIGGRPVALTKMTLLTWNDTFPDLSVFSVMLTFQTTSFSIKFVISFGMKLLPSGTTSIRFSTSLHKRRWAVLPKRTNSPSSVSSPAVTVSLYLQVMLPYSIVRKHVKSHWAKINVIYAILPRRCHSNPGTGSALVCISKWSWTLEALWTRIIPPRVLIADFFDSDGSYKPNPLHRIEREGNTMSS